MRISAARGQWSDVLEGRSCRTWQDLKRFRLWEAQIKWSMVDMHCLEEFSKVWEDGVSFRWRWADVNPHDCKYLDRIRPCSLTGVVETGPPDAPGSAFRSPAKINNPEGLNFSLITWRVSNASLKESVHPVLEGRYTENMKVLLSTEIPMQQWLANCLSFCTLYKFLRQRIATPPWPLRYRGAQYTASSSLGEEIPQAWKSGCKLSRKLRSKLCSQCSEIQQISRVSKKSCKKRVLNLTPLMLIAPTCNDWRPLEAWEPRVF